ncbi:SGNH/GDSL hydrolase family protein [Amycolatopsis sp. FDAARGOS 1241]|uniref:SGNH/GDSL hydrolase family protein n=1 Tax=Amycolatopsis sp. FDAARGOS 1241 TaxID=2778070 RepID=UPI0019504F6C|nr:SGNH/GDSL hydrolase family protein [Amycolatopsis sp. FDAARGOS 1241]QRP48314.1 SGNH/GDSL hydrolase family protein [Amycolatopsis sp. FDAARGOS 1241]
MRKLFAALAVVVLALATASTANAAPRQDYRHYVALGDSYTAGPLIPAQRLDPLGCARSTANYPSILAAALHVGSFTDISCSGAGTSNMTQTQSVPLGVNPPQFSALRLDTDLVTLGIGGNDSSVFGTIVGTCPALRGQDPSGNPCQRHFTTDGVDSIKAALATTQQSVETVLAGIHARSPQAKVLAIGYPRIAPASGYCPDVLPLADGDYTWLTSVEEALNAAIENAVEADGHASYVDTFTPSAGHDACAPGGSAWINGKDTKLLAAAAYHPLPAGMAGLAGIVYRQLEN